MALEGFTAVKVFSATKAKDREVLGEQITAWLEGNPRIQVVGKVVALSSDREFHCLSIVVFFVSS